MLNYIRKKINSKDESHMLFYYKEYEIQYLSSEEMIKYARNKYINKGIESINKKAFLKDLALFKAFRTEIELEIKNRAEFFSYVSMILVIFTTILTSNKISDESYREAARIVGYIAISLLVYILYRFVINKMDPKFEKYQTVNYIIYNLEFKKEDLDFKFRQIKENFNYNKNSLKENNTLRIKSCLRSRQKRIKQKKLKNKMIRQKKVYVKIQMLNL